MRELYNQQISELNLLIQSKRDLEERISDKEQHINQILSTLVGKFFKRARNISGIARVGNSRYTKYIDTLHGVCQVLRIDKDFTYIQEYEESIKEVTPYNRLTFECSFISVKTVDFLNCYKEQISIEEYISAIKMMQDRDSYSCWHTTIRVQ